MKKIFSVLLILAMLASAVALASCDRGENPHGKDGETQSESETAESLTPATLKGKTPKEAYRAALNSSLSNGTVEMTMVSEMKSEETELKMTQVVTTKLDGDRVYMSMAVDGQKSEVWYDGETLYQKMGEAKYKETVSAEVFEQYYASADFSDEMLLKLSDAVFADKTFEKDVETGNYTVSLILTAEDLGDFIEAMGADPAETALTSDQIEYVLTFDQSAKLIGLSFGFGVAVEDMSSTVSVAMSYSDMGSTEVTLPEDAESYPAENSSVN